MKTVGVILVLMSITLSVLAQENPHKAEYQRLLRIDSKAAEAYLKESYPEWDFKKLRGLCMIVDSQEKDPKPQGRFKWKYQRRILEATRINPETESEEQIGKKIARMWKVAEELGLAGACNNAKFDVIDGSIIKFAVCLKFEEFIIDVTFWGLNLNKVDLSDGKTVLDYTQEQIDRNIGIATEPDLRRIYETLRKAGAKHAREL